MNKLHIKLYSTKQEDKEAVGIFLQRKYLLDLRLLPQATEGQLVSLLLEAIKPTIKKVLRAATINSFEGLVERAVQAESDEAEENPRKPFRENQSKAALSTQQTQSGADTAPPTRPRRNATIARVVIFIGTAL